MQDEINASNSIQGNSKQEDVSSEIGHFYIGDEDLLSQLDQQKKQNSDQVDSRQQDDAFAEIRIQIGSLLKTDTVSLLLGAGASVSCGGQLIGSVPIAVERTLLKEGISGEKKPRVRSWLRLFYLATRLCAQQNKTGIVPLTREEIIKRQKAIDTLTTKDESLHRLPSNYEKVLALLYQWRLTLPEKKDRLHIKGSVELNATGEDLNTAIQLTTWALAHECNLPVCGREDKLSIHKALIRKLLTRPLNLKRVNLFTLNYDTLIEQAADAEGVVLLDGFVGTQCRVFRPESYEQDLYFPAETTEGRVHRFDRVLHLYKLHGSIMWQGTESSIDNPYGVLSAPFVPKNNKPLMIYPTPAKYGETLGLPYSELFRRFAAALCRPQSVLFVIGYGFGDEHVNTIIRQALAIPSFRLVIVDPSPMNSFVNTLREQKDRRVWIAEGQKIGKLEGFVEHILPDLRDEEVLRKVLETYRALSRKQMSGEGQY